MGMIACGATVTSTDWLVDPSPYVASVKQQGASIVMENGLVRRGILTAAGGATWSWRNVMTDEEYVRSPSAEATITIRGRELNVGGLSGVPVFGYTRPQDLRRCRGVGEYQLTNWCERPIVARLAWKRRSEWSARDLPWPPKGREVILSFAAKDRAHPAVDIHYEIYDGAPLIAKWMTVVNDTAKCTGTVPVWARFSIPQTGL